MDCVWNGNKPQPFQNVTQDFSVVLAQFVLCSKVMEFLFSTILRCSNNYFIVLLAFSDILMGLAYAWYNLAHMELPEIQQALGECILYSEKYNCSHLHR